MARMIPDSNSTRIIFTSGAESLFYAEAQKQLSQDWQVYHSCVLSEIEDERGLAENEIDFVLYHRRWGLILVEVKGGRIRFDPARQTFYSINQRDQSFEIKNPFQQALAWKSRLIRRLKKDRIRVPISHAVCFPSVSKRNLPHIPGVAPELILDQDDLAQLEKTLERLVQQSQPEKFLQFENVDEDIDRFFAGVPFTSKMRIRHYIDVHDEKLSETESILEALVSPVAGTKRLGIEGEAGTGKTVLARKLAHRFAGSGERVLLLSSSEALTQLFRRSLPASVTVKTYADLGKDVGVNLLVRPQSETQIDAQRWTQEVAPQKVKEALQAKEPFDVIICDEAQDVQTAWWSFIQVLEKQEGRFYALFDRNQGIFSDASEPESIIPVPPSYFPLVSNYRNTVEIAQFALPFRTGKKGITGHNTRLGFTPEILNYSEGADFTTKLATLIQQLVRDEGLRPEEIVIISARQADAKESLLRQMSTLGAVPVHRGTDAKAGHVTLSTIASFKGLEAKVVIVVGLSEYNLPITHPIMKSLVYVALTRAQHLLYVFVKKGDAKETALIDAAKNSQLAGGLVIDAEHGSKRFSGKVVEMKPQRIGWVMVDDATLNRNLVAFFPQDFSKISIGDRVSFVPEKEGQLIIATEMLVL